MTSPVDAELAKCLERAKVLRELREKVRSGDWAPCVWYGEHDGGWVATGPHREIADDCDDDSPGCDAEQIAQIDAAFIAGAAKAIADEIRKLAPGKEVKPLSPEYDKIFQENFKSLLSTDEVTPKKEGGG